MNKLLLTVIVTLSIAFHSSGQKENNIWTFSKYIGLNFNTTPPTIYRDSCDTYEGCASVSDTSGNLLFYCDGTRMFDRRHLPMPNGSGIVGHRSSTQGVAIASIYRKDSLYFVFTVGANDKARGDLRYSIVDMKLNSGFGDIPSSSKNILVDTNLGEKMIIVGNCDNQWLLTHRSDTPAFYAYKLNLPSGPASPVISKVGSNYNISYGIGEMKVSKDFRKLALSNYSLSSGSYIACIQLYDFNVLTGIVSNYKNIEDFPSNNVYGLEFSADASKLYAGTLNYGMDTGGLYQYDLSLSSIPLMRSIKYKITRHSVWGMRRGPDDQVYIILDTFPRNLSRIQNPNLLGATCNFQENFLSTGFSADNRNIGLGNNFISRFKGYYDSTFYNSTYSFCSGYSKTISGSGYDYYHWFDGDTSKAKTFTKAGKYWLVSGNYCEKRIDTFNIIEQAPTYSFNKKDTLICPRSWITISGRPTFDSFVWFDGNKKITRNVFGLSGNYWVKSIRDCEVIIDTFHFIEQPIATIKNFYEITQCLGLQTFLFGKSGVDNYKWSTGDTTNNIYVYSPGKYWTMSIKDCILFVDTFYVKYIPYSTTKIEIDTPICFQDNATILAPSSFDTYLWNSGSTKKDTSLFTSSKVSVVATNNTTCQILKKTYNVDFVSFITNSRDTFTCNQDTIILDATVNVPNATYRWKTGETTPSIKVTKAGTKIIFVTVLGCTGTDTFEVKNKTIPIDIGEDQIVCEGQKIILSANIDDAKYHWNTGAETKTIEVFKSGVYSISVSKDDCFAGDEVNIYFDICDNCIAFPNAFTPNGDGINDYFKPIINCNTSSFEFTLFNRWGQEIFASNNPNQKWDGTWLGQVQDNGVYFYMLKVKFTAQDQTEKMYNGELTLIR